MDKGSWVVLFLKLILWTGAIVISLLSVLNKIPEWLILFPAAPFVFFAIRHMAKGH